MKITRYFNDKYLFDLDYREPIVDRELIVIGDIHGEFDRLYNSLCKYDCSNAYYICLGDIGLMTTEQIMLFDIPGRLRKIQEFLEKRHSRLFFGRGNHDNPEFFKTECPEIFDEFDRIYTLPDHSLLKFDNKYLFWIGGGISIDRLYREVGLWYFKNEKVDFDFDLFEKVEAEYSPRIILSHGLPHVAPPVVFSRMVERYCSLDVNLESELNEERKNFTKVFDIFNKNNKLKKWYSGHYHTSDGITYKDVILQNVDIMTFVALYI